MKTAFLTVGAVVLCEASRRSVGRVQAGPDLQKYKPVFEVYGAVDETLAEEARLLRAASFMRPLARHTGRQTSECEYAVDALFLLDSSGSMTAQEFAYAVAELPKFGARILADHPGSTLSLATFEDKPIETLGETTDQCLQIDIIGARNVSAFTDAIDKVVVGGGYDWPETQLAAIMQALFSPETINWFPANTGVPVIFLITDAAFHYSDDTSYIDYSQLVPWGNGSYEEALADIYCTGRYYPDPVFVANELIPRAMLAVGVVNSDLYDQLAVRSYQWFNTLLGQPGEFVQRFGSNYTDWMGSFESMLNGIHSVICEGSTPFPISDTAADETLLSEDVTGSGNTGAASGDVSALTGSGLVSGNTGAASGDVSALTGSGLVSGNTITGAGSADVSALTGSGLVSGNTGAASGDVSALTGTGLVSGNTGAASGDVSALTGSGLVSGNTITGAGSADVSALTGSGLVSGNTGAASGDVSALTGTGLVSGNTITGSASTPATDSGEAGTDLTTDLCDCTPEQDGDCCFKQPEILIALLNRPAEFDVHYKA